ncbi:MAG: hypothetical protein N2Z76_00900 [Treponemataceae bacterium]|nr:hypothetical protein [Treponemataceae bacterium]
MLFLGIALFSVVIAPFVSAQTVVRGEIRIDLEPVYLSFLEEHGPLNTTAAHQRALEEAFFTVSAHIYGWRFSYEIGERARKVEEKLELFSEGSIRWGDSGFSVTDARVEGSVFVLWVEYRPTPEEERRLAFWKSGQALLLQGLGTGSLMGPNPMPEEGTAAKEENSPKLPAPLPGPWYDGKRQALEDAARTAIRAYLRKTERNRPKEAHGYIALASFPRYWVEGGRWTCQARFRVIITEVVPFAVH